MRLAVVGAGWAGCAAAIHALDAGHQVTLFEASRTPGGRARALPLRLPDGRTVMVDNGQHILIGAYTDTLAMMRRVGVDPRVVLKRQPLALVFSDGGGLRMPDWPAPWDVLAGIVGARGWSIADRLSLIRHAVGWRARSFRCAPHLSVAALCRGLRDTPMAELVEPLCVSALNTPASEASASVFLRVMRDALFGAPGSSHLLLPQKELGALLPDATLRWCTQRGAEVHLGTRVRGLTHGPLGWQLDDEVFDRVVLATPASDAARLVQTSLKSLEEATRPQAQAWAEAAGALAFTAITTVYAWSPGTRLPQAMTALRAGNGPEGPAPAQFVFDRSHLGGPVGLLAFVVSASAGAREDIEIQVIAQAKRELAVKADLQAIQTVVEKRATFACTPGLLRPGTSIAPGLSACGDYIDGPYPATLEGAVRSARTAITRG